MKKIMIHMDALVDFRIAAINALSPESLPKLIPIYEDRLFDDFETEHLKQSDYEAKIKDLQSLIETAPASSIGIYIQTRIDAIRQDAPHESFKVSINTYPVELPSEAKIAITEIHESLFGVEVECVHIPYMLYPDIISDYSLLACYTLDWTSEINEWLAQKPLPKLVVYSARILKVAAKENYRKGPKNPFDSIELAYSPVFTLQFLPIKMYNAMNDSKVEEIIRLGTSLDEADFNPQAGDGV